MKTQKELLRLEHNESYLEKLAKSICDFYISSKEICTEQYNMAESQELYSLYESVDNEELIHQLFSKVSIVILTANKYEKNILHTNWHRANNQKIKRIEINLMPRRETAKITYAYYFQWHEYSILHIEAQYTGSYTMGGSADLVRYVRDNPYLYPTSIVSLGICFGLHEDKQTLGDTVLSEKVYPYFIGAKWGEESFRVTDNNMFRVNDALHQKIQRKIIDLNLLNGFSFNAKFGNYITGEAVISNQGIRDCFSGITTQDVSAGEMEGYGLFKECCGKDYVIPCIIIKSICDWGVLKNLADYSSACEILYDCGMDKEEVETVKDRLQAYAAHNAYCVLDVLLKYRVFPESIYTQIKTQLIADDYERVIYDRRFKEEAEKSIGFIGAPFFSDEFFDGIRQSMQSEGLLSILDNVNGSSPRVWKINKD